MLVFITSLTLVFIAELGDKTQLVAMAFAAKYNAWKVVLGVLAAVFVLNFIAVILGSYITSVIPLNTIRIIAAVVFIVFGLFNLVDKNDEENGKSFKYGIILTVALTFFIGELGDKTQLMTITLAAQYNSPYAVFLGSTLGMLACDSLGIIVGSTIFKKIPKKAVKLIASCIFLFFGSMGFYNALPGEYLSPLNITLFVVLLFSAILFISRYNMRRADKVKSDSNI